MDEELLTIEQAARLLNINAETIERWIERGLAVSQEAGGEVRIARPDLEAFLVHEGQGRPRDAATEL